MPPPFAKVGGNGKGTTAFFKIEKKQIGRLSARKVREDLKGLRNRCARSRKIAEKKVPRTETKRKSQAENQTGKCHRSDNAPSCSLGRK